MPGAPSFLDEPEGTQEAIMHATYRALREHGYAGLTIKRIGDHFAKSKSLLYHHYDSKDDLLLDFLEFMLDEFQSSVPVDADRGPRERLDLILDRVLADTMPDDQRDFTRAMVELRAQSAHDDRYRDHFTRSDQFFRDRLAAVIETGIEAGEFRDADPDQVAALLITVATGSMSQRVTADVDHTEQVRAELDAYVDATLLAEDTDE